MKQVEVVEISRGIGIGHEIDTCTDVVFSNHQMACSVHPEWSFSKLSGDWTLREVDPPVDHKELLKKYILYVYRCEGSNFLVFRDEAFAEVKFTDAEWQELQDLNTGGN